MEQYIFVSWLERIIFFSFIFRTTLCLCYLMSFILTAKWKMPLCRFLSTWVKTAHKTKHHLECIMVPHNYGVVDTERDLWKSPCPSLWKAGCPGQVRVADEDLHGGDYSLFGQPLPVLSHPHSTEVKSAFRCSEGTFCVPVCTHFLLSWHCPVPSIFAGMLRIKGKTNTNVVT